MRFHPSLLAIGLLLCVALACKMGNTNNSNNGNANNANNANSTSNTNTNANTPPKNASGIHVDNVYMAKTADGKATTSFSSTDHTVYCVAELNKLAKGTQVKFSWIAVDVQGEDKGSKIKDVDYTTGSLENIVKAHLTLPQDWPTGQYKVEVYINGDLDQSINYTVE